MRFLRAGLVTSHPGGPGIAPPALRPAREVLRLSAIGGAGNPRAQPLARSAAWTEPRRSIAEASAVVERRKASALRSARCRIRRCGHWKVRLSALRLPSLWESFSVACSVACSVICSVIWHSPGAIAPRERIFTTNAIMTKRKKRGRRGLYNKRLTPDEQVVQRKAAFAAIRRLYSESLPLWRFCRSGFCRRHKRCNGKNVGRCLQRGWPRMPPEQQARAYREVIAGGPRRVPPESHVERDLRGYPPSNFVH